MPEGYSREFSGVEFASFCSGSVPMPRELGCGPSESSELCGVSTSRSVDATAMVSKLACFCWRVVLVSNSPLISACNRVRQHEHPRTKKDNGKMILLRENKTCSQTQPTRCSLRQNSPRLISCVFQTMTGFAPWTRLRSWIRPNRCRERN